MHTKDWSSTISELQAATRLTLPEVYPSSNRNNVTADELSPTHSKPWTSPHGQQALYEHVCGVRRLLDSHSGCCGEALHVGPRKSSQNRKYDLEIT
jgi:hypothetical protein